MIMNVRTFLFGLCCLSILASSQATLPETAAISEIGREVWSLDISRDGQTIAVGRGDGAVLLVDAHSLEFN